MRRGAWLLLAALLLLPACEPDRAARPGCAATAGTLAFTGFVVDQAGVLPADRTRAIAATLDRLQRTTGRQVVVVTVKSLGGRAIGSYATELGNCWGVGRVGLDDGVVLLVAPNERQVRIAVGRGLERVLTDPISDAILRRDMLPAFRRGDLAGGIAAGVEAATARLAGKTGG